MLNKQLLKEVLAANQRYIEGLPSTPIARLMPSIPANLAKTVIYYGVRRSGKTYLLYRHFLAHRDRALYVDLEDDRLAGFELADFERLREAFLEERPQLAGQGVVLLMDEVQLVDGWERFCRRAVERGKNQVLVSGSSSRIMPTEIATELRGRAWGIEVLPFSFGELLAAKGVAVPTTMARDATVGLVSQIMSYLTWGAFPEVTLLAQERDRATLLRTYLSAMFFRDLVERYNVSNIPLLTMLNDRLLASCATKVSLSTLYKRAKGQVPLSKDSLYAYYHHFLDSMLIFEARLFSESSFKRQRNPPKVYLVDTGLCRHVTSADTGRLLENAVFLELRRRGLEVFYHQAAHECDFITRDQAGQLRPLQVCMELTPTSRQRELDGLVEACRYCDQKRGVIVTLSDQAELHQEGITIEVVPAWRFLLGLAD